MPGVSRLQFGQVVFDAEIDAAGEHLYFADGTFDGQPVPRVADLAVAQRDGQGFRRLDPALLARLNTPLLEYAPAISIDGLELFFTRLDPAIQATTILHARRSATDQPFGDPEAISTITGFVEAPTLSPDGRELFFHRREGGRFRLARVRR